MHKIHADYYETNQTYIFGGFYPGSESGLFDMGLLGPQLNPLGVQFYQYWVTKLSDSQESFIFYHLLTGTGLFSDSTWTIDRFDFSSIQLADEINPAGINVCIIARLFPLNELTVRCLEQGHKPRLAEVR